MQDFSYVKSSELNKCFLKFKIFYSEKVFITWQLFQNNKPLSLIGRNIIYPKIPLEIELKITLNNLPISSQIVFNIYKPFKPREMAIQASTTFRLFSVVKKYFDQLIQNLEKRLV